MKIKLKNNYWKRKEDWQKLANFNLWIIIVESLLIGSVLYFKNQFVVLIIFAVIIIGLVLPQKLSYYFYSKEISKIRRDKIIKEAEDYNNGKQET